jgi:hypothetical protein
MDDSEIICQDEEGLRGERLKRANRGDTKLISSFFVLASAVAGYVRRWGQTPFHATTTPLNTDEAPTSNVRRWPASLGIFGEFLQTP